MKTERISIVELILKYLNKETEKIKKAEIHIKLYVFQTIIPKNWTKA